jgi:hypothetical protein
MTQIMYLPTSVLYPDSKSNRMIMREVCEPETMQFNNAQEAENMKNELSKCGLIVTMKKVKIRHDNVSLFFDSGQIFLLDIYPPEIDIDTLSISSNEAYNDDLDPNELPALDDFLVEFIKF